MAKTAAGRQPVAVAPVTTRMNNRAMAVGMLRAFREEDGGRARRGLPTRGLRFMESLGVLLTLTDSFVQQHAGGYGDIQAFNRAELGEADHEVARLLSELTQAGSFSAHYEDDAAGEVRFVRVLGCFCICAYDPKPGLFQHS